MKVSKAKANYRKGSSTRNCGVCRYMNADGTCDKVAGIVVRGMVSDYFKAKSGARS